MRRFNIRLGGASTDSTGRPTICVDVRIVNAFGVESCGTGQGVIHEEPGIEMAHFRGTWTFLARATSTGTAKPRGGVGWAELQVGPDPIGFQFGEPGPGRISVAGPEGTLQVHRRRRGVRARRPPDHAEVERAAVRLGGDRLRLVS